MAGNDYAEAFEDFSGSLYEGEGQRTWLDAFVWMTGIDDLKWGVPIAPRRHRKLFPQDRRHRAAGCGTGSYDGR